MNRTYRQVVGAFALGLGLMIGGPFARAAGSFVDGFDVPGDRLDLAKWTTEIGPTSFLGRTQLRDWVTPGGSGQFPVAGGEAQMALNTFNPTGFSMYGTHAKTLESFVPSAGFDIALSVRMRLTTVQPGLVFGIYFFGCDSGPCATHHDELDIELVTNFLQPGAAPMRVQLNRYAAEPLGAGHGPIVNLPAGFDPLVYHDWKIVWGQGRATYSVDGVDLYTATDFIPQGTMQGNVIAWAPAPEWPDAFSASLQPVGSAALDQSFVARIDSVSVAQIAAVPEPEQWLLMIAALAMTGARNRMARSRLATLVHAAGTSP